MSALANIIRRSANFSECWTYRYTLDRYWDDDLPQLLFVLLNPSTADAIKDDPTNRRGMGFARRWGFGSCIFVNLFAFRATKPADLKKADDPIGPFNDAYLVLEAETADRIVLAWGAHGGWRNRDQEVLKLLDGHKLYCLGQTKDGHPKHPLYLKADTPLMKWEGR